MKTNINDMDDLLVKELTGEATPAERSLVQQWLAADPYNQQYYEHFKLIWEESARLSATLPLDEDAAWRRFQHRVETNQFAAKRNAPVFLVNNRWMRVAAVIALVAGLGWLSYALFNNNSGTLTNFQTAENIKTDTLPDGSLVTLNKFSEISYPTKFSGKTRPVSMKGEAFFNVLPDKSKPFVIQAGEVTVQVVGTSFNVRSKADSTEVIVETGIVTVTANEQTITLQAGEKTVIHHNESHLQKQQSTDKLYNYYRTRKFICEDTPLWKLVDMINEAYDVHIEFGRSELRDLPQTTTYDNESLENILNVISQTNDITVIRENGRIILR